VDGDDVLAAAELVPEASALDRDDARRHAERHCSVDKMVESYVSMFGRLVAVDAA
jgi:hypothetical protein